MFCRASTSYVSQISLDSVELPLNFRKCMRQDCFLSNYLFLWQLAILVLIDGALRCTCIVIPFIAFQVYGYRNLYLGALMCMATTLINLPVTYVMLIALDKKL